MPKQGPNDGSRRATTARLPNLFRPNVRPMLTVVLPMPALVGLMAVTSISRLFLTFSSSMSDVGTLAMYRP